MACANFPYGIICKVVEALMEGESSANGKEINLQGRRECMDIALVSRDFHSAYLRIFNGLSELRYSHNTPNKVELCRLTGEGQQQQKQVFCGPIGFLKMLAQRGKLAHLKRVHITADTHKYAGCSPLNDVFSLLKLAGHVGAEATSSSSSSSEIAASMTPSKNDWPTLEEVEAIFHETMSTVSITAVQLDGLLELNAPTTLISISLFDCAFASFATPSPFISPVSPPSNRLYPNAAFSRITSIRLFTHMWVNQFDAEFGGGFDPAINAPFPSNEWAAIIGHLLSSCGALKELRVGFQVVGDFLMENDHISTAFNAFNRAVRGMSKEVLGAVPAIREASAVVTIDIEQTFTLVLIKGTPPFLRDHPLLKEGVQKSAAGKETEFTGEIVVVDGGAAEGGEALQQAVGVASSIDTRVMMQPTGRKVVKWCAKFEDPIAMMGRGK